MQLSNTYSILTHLVTYAKCYQIVLNIRADRLLYGHLTILPSCVRVVVFLAVNPIAEINIQ